MSIISRPPSSEYRESWDRIFRPGDTEEETPRMIDQEEQFSRRVILNYLDGSVIQRFIQCRDRRPLPDELTFGDLRFQRVGVNIYNQQE